MTSVPGKHIFTGRAAPLLLALIIITGCLLRLHHFNTESRREVTGYYSLAVNLKATGVLAYPGSACTPSAYRAPLYPAFLFLFAGEAMPDMRAAFLAQLALFIVAVLLVWAAAGSMTGSPAAALTAAAIYTFHPWGLLYSASFNVEFFYGFLIAATALAIARAAAERTGVTDWLMAFIFTGISIGCKSPMALFPPLLAVWLYSAPSSSAALRRKLPLFVLLSYLTLAPWVLRNAKQFREFIPLERNAARGLIYTAGKGIPKACMPAVAAEIYAKDGKGALYSPETSVASLLGGIVSRPGKYLSGLLKRLLMAFGTFPALFILSAAGSWFYRKRGAAAPLGLLALYFTGVHLVFSFEKHYLIPVLPVLSVLAAAPAGRFLGSLKGPPETFNGRAAGAFILSAAACVILAIYALSVYLLAAETLKPGLKPLANDAVETLVPVFKTGNPAELAAYHNQKGVLELFSGNFEPAKRDFISAINADPDYPDPYLNLAYALRALGESEEALQACRAAEEKHSPGGRAGAYSDTMLAEMLKCQEFSLNKLGRKKDAGAIAARRRALENKIAAGLIK